MHTMVNIPSMHPAKEVVDMSPGAVYHSDRRYWIQGRQMDGAEPGIPTGNQQIRHRKPRSISCAMARMTPQLGQSPT